MRAHVSGISRSALLGLALALAPSPGGAEVTRVDIQRREDVLGGKAFGSVGRLREDRRQGPLRRRSGDPRNRIIADLDKAPKNAQGKVEFSSDLYIIKPKDPARGNGVVFFDIVNRGDKALAPRRSAAARRRRSDHRSRFRRRRTCCARATRSWRWAGSSTSAEGKGLVGFDAPMATDKRQADHRLGADVVPLERRPSPSFEYAATSYNTSAYPPLDLEQRAVSAHRARGDLRPGAADPARRMAVRPSRERHDRSRPQLDPPEVGDEAGTDLRGRLRDEEPAGRRPRAGRDPRHGLGAEVRPDAVAPGRYAYMYGSSQTGRRIRHIVYEGFTIDEQERKAFDAAFVQTGATGYGSFNERFAQPNELGSFTQTKFPVPLQDDDRSGHRPQGRAWGAHSRRPRAEDHARRLVLRVLGPRTRGGAAAHVARRPRGCRGRAERARLSRWPARARRGQLPACRQRPGEFKENTNDYRWAQRGLLAALDAWVRQGTPPPAEPPSEAVRRDARRPRRSGVSGHSRREVAGARARRLSLRRARGRISALPFMVPKVDADGNDVGGIRLPEQAVPLATLTGWQFRSERIGSPDTLLAMAGAYIPFPTTRAEREKVKDPRLSIEERYGHRADYLQKVQESAKPWRGERYILQDDVAAIVQAAGRHWDALMAPGPPIPPVTPSPRRDEDSRGLGSPPGAALRRPRPAGDGPHRRQGRGRAARLRHRDRPPRAVDRRRRQPARGDRHRRRAPRLYRQRPQQHRVRGGPRRGQGDQAARLAAVPVPPRHGDPSRRQDPLPDQRAEQAAPPDRRREPRDQGAARDGEGRLAHGRAVPERGVGLHRRPRLGGGHRRRHPEARHREAPAGGRRRRGHRAVHRRPAAPGGKQEGQRHPALRRPRRPLAGPHPGGGGSGAGGHLGRRQARAGPASALERGLPHRPREPRGAGQGPDRQRARAARSSSPAASRRSSPTPGRARSPSSTCEPFAVRSTHPAGKGPDGMHLLRAAP